jgi:hypothetical protein
MRLTRRLCASAATQASGATPPQGLPGARGFAAAHEAALADDDPRPVEMKGVSMSGKPLYLDMQARRAGQQPLGVCALR